MSTFLEKILTTKQLEVTKLHELGRIHPEVLQQLPATRGFRNHLTNQNRLTVVAEVKQASPSKGLIASEFRPAETALAYEAAGAAAISVLTDETYFRGSIEDLRTVRSTVQLPVLRKDFIIDEVQVDEARLAGADAVLLICAALSSSRLQALSAYAKSIGLDVLIEVHNLGELDAALAAEPSVLGVNNRDLRTFEVSLTTTEQVAGHVPAGIPFIAESGIQSAEDALQMAQCGACGVLVGESLMRSATAESRRALLESLQVARTPDPATLQRRNAL